MNLSAKTGDAGLVPGLRRFPGEGKGRRKEYLFFPGKAHGQRDLVGYNPWDCQELDTLK